MKPSMLASADTFMLDEQSDVREHTRPDLPQTRMSPPPRQRVLPPPPPPPRAATTVRIHRGLWFMPSLGVVVGLSVVGVFALVRLGPAEPRDAAVGGVPVPAASAPVEITQVAAARDPEPVAAPPAAAEQAPVEEETAAEAPDEEQPEAAAPQYALRPHTGLLVLKSNVPSAVYVDGRKLGNSSRHVFSLRPGEYVVALENAVTDQRIKFPVVVTEGSVIERRVRLRRASPAPRTLRGSHEDVAEEQGIDAQR